MVRKQKGRDGGCEGCSPGWPYPETSPWVKALLFGVLGLPWGGEQLRSPVPLLSSCSSSFSTLCSAFSRAAKILIFLGSLIQALRK